LASQIVGAKTSTEKKKNMFMVYWTEVQNGDKTPKQKEFDSQSMAAALGFMEELRGRPRAGEALSFVVMQSENPNSVGNPGVAGVGPDYNWRKRRP
jgi:hypothetical protein